MLPFQDMDALEFTMLPNASPRNDDDNIPRI